MDRVTKVVVLARLDDVRHQIHGCSSSVSTVAAADIKTSRREQILGIQFFNGTPREAVAEMLEKGGFLVAPSGTCFERFIHDEGYRRAIITADLALADSGLMVSLARVLMKVRVTRISGLAYLQELIRDPQFEIRNAFWILPNERSAERLQAWAANCALPLTRDQCYVAPIYASLVRDEKLVALVEHARPANVVIGVGAGPQEKLGYYLRNKLNYRPAIHCVGGAVGILTGDQVAIPAWADQFYLGWLLRLLSQPRVFIPRLWRARVLPRLISRYGRELPEMRSGTSQSGR